MNLRDVLVFLDPGAASEERLRLAAQLARERGAKLSAVFVNTEPPAEQVQLGFGMSRRGLVPHLMPCAIEQPPSRTVGEVLEQRYRSQASRNAGDWHEIGKSDQPRLMALARAADMLVIGQTNPDARSDIVCQPEQIVRNCGRPVLMVPYIGNFQEVGRRVLIAWDASRETARAVNDALPLIETAEVVTMIRIYDSERELERNRYELQDMLRHLERHGVPVRLAETPSNGNSASDTLLSRAMDFYADMIVAGAFRHSSIREVLRSNVGRDLLRRMTVPVLVSH